MSGPRSLFITCMGRLESVCASGCCVSVASAARAFPRARLAAKAPATKATKTKTPLGDADGMENVRRCRARVVVKSRGWLFLGVTKLKKLS